MGIAAALIAVAAGMLLVRAGWGGWRALAAAGWAVIAAGTLLLAAGDGAWGLAVGTVVATGVALAMVLQAGWTSPVKTRRAPREAPVAVLPRSRGDLARRVGVFALVVPVAFVAAQWLAFGAQALARRGGAGDADAIVLALFLQPVVWGILMTIQMTQAGTARMIAPPAAAAAIGTILWGIS